MNRLLLVMGLRGALLERLRFSDAATPPPELTAGAFKIWMRPKAIEVLEDLQAECDLAVWSSTTRPNSDLVTNAAFPADGKVQMKFVWSRENTVADDFRRSIIVDPDDEFATIKDAKLVWRHYPQYTPQRTVLIDDTPSKVRRTMDNFLWLSTFGEAEVAAGGDDELQRMRDFILTKLVNAPDVRDILPHRL
jgi:hypothetical protein